MFPRKTQGQDGFATSFPVGLLHPLQHAGLARRTPDCPSLAKWGSPYNLALHFATNEEVFPKRRS